MERGNNKKVAATEQWCKEPNKHCNQYNIDVHIEEKCWKFLRELHPKNKKKNNKKKNLMATDSCNQIKCISDVDDNIIYIKQSISV